MINKILFQGDSITDVGRAREENLPLGIGMGTGYPQLVTARLITDSPERPWEINNKGISGNRVVDLYSRWKIDALNLKPELISILIGINDTWHEFNRQNGVEVPRYEKMYRELLTWTKEVLPEVKLVLMEPFCFCFGAVAPEWLPEVEERRKVVKKLAEEFNAVFIPCQSILDKALEKAPREFWLRDGVHPTLAGHQLLADAWIEATKDLLK
ncbi:MAG: SGNH/GDSL hydrolase family protein [Lentisphaeria bacterium]|nr:SGNH/GDSL hydrolase family protein [Lentisphaeria bacterium]